MPPKIRIDDFLKKDSRPDKMKLFEKLSKGKTKEEMRELEMTMLGPDPLQQHIGEERRYAVNSECTAKIVFSCEEEMEFFGKHITITEYVEKSITQIKIFLDLFKAMDAGKISYDKKAGDFTFLGMPDVNPETAEPTQPGLGRKRFPKVPVRIENTALDFKDDGLTENTQEEIKIEQVPEKAEPPVRRFFLKR